MEINEYDTREIIEGINELITIADRHTGNMMSLVKAYILKGLTTHLNDIALLGDILSEINLDVMALEITRTVGEKSIATMRAREHGKYLAMLANNRADKDL